MEFYSISEVIERIEIFENLYDVVRIVDPVIKKQLYFKDKQLQTYENSCFEFWKKDMFCENCISMRAFNEKQSFVKIEYTHEKIYMVMAVPSQIEDKLLIIELLKDTTNSIVFSNEISGKFTENHAIIDIMNRLVLKDALTDLYNWRYISEKLPVEIISAALSGEYLSVIIADIDFFKNVNDTYGHLTGNIVLKRFADLLKECVRDERDWIARYGGEEFLICLPKCDVKKAAEIAECMRIRTEKETIKFENHNIQITASFGICSMMPNKNSTIDDIIKFADNMLYVAKNNGRNRIEFTVI